LNSVKTELHGIIILFYAKQSHYTEMPNLFLNIHRN
jgi:hypothetical protein